MNLETAIQNKVHILTEERKREVLEFVDKLLDGEKPPSIWQKLDERLKQVPAEEIAELPTDASENLDHYLYGAPKKIK